jgi:SAM-dependent methyltransferase
MAATCPIDFDVAHLRASVSEVYTRVAGDPTGDFHFHRGLTYAVEQLGYDRRELEALPSVATERFAGVGNPLALGRLAPGETVLDHACGAGMDALLAARRVGVAGRVIGVDMTPAMREKATLAAKLAGMSERVSIVPGLLEDLPLEDSSVDVVISNGVLNLSPDKRRALREVFRVLRPGGRLWLADVVVTRELILSVRRNVELWAACIAGALPEQELFELAAAAGLADGSIEARFDSFANTSAEDRVSPDLRPTAVNFSARKPAAPRADQSPQSGERHERHR